VPIASATVRREDGYTLVELIAVMAIIAALLALAVASYTGARVEAKDAAAKSNIAVAVPVLHAFYIDNGTYAGMTVDTLRSSYGGAIGDITIVSAGGNAYCVSATVDGATWYKAGPSGPITRTACS
jgi:prepilin-type N-terminal cleavage/methylation domain-containing protein